MSTVGPFTFERTEEGQVRTTLNGTAGVGEIEAYLRALIAAGAFV